MFLWESGTTAHVRQKVYAAELRVWPCPYEVGNTRAHLVSLGMRSGSRREPLEVQVVRCAALGMFPRFLSRRIPEANSTPLRVRPAVG
jgi:hypothetical protein